MNAVVCDGRAKCPKGGHGMCEKRSWHGIWRSKMGEAPVGMEFAVKSVER